MKHGTDYAYGVCKCRCEVCVTTVRERRREYYHRRKAKRLAQIASGELVLPAKPLKVAEGRVCKRGHVVAGDNARRVGKNSKYFQCVTCVRAAQAVIRQHQRELRDRDKKQPKLLRLTPRSTPVQGGLDHGHQCNRRSVNDDTHWDHRRSG